jgi:hypothetical protein
MPLKWIMHGNYGLTNSLVGGVVKRTSVACSVTSVAGEVVPTALTSDEVLNYDAASDQYSIGYSAKRADLTVGCYKLSIELSTCAGTTHECSFRLRSSNNSSSSSSTPTTVALCSAIFPKVLSSHHDYIG